MNYYLAFDIGGTDVKYGILNDGFEIIEKASFPTNASLGATQMIKRMVEIALDYKNKFILNGIAISSAGVIEPTRGEVMHTTGAIKDYDFMPVKKILEENTGIKTEINNDVNCFALCEAKVGAGKDTDSFLTMTIGTGIGGAIISKNELIYGANYAAGEWGRMIIPQGIYEEEASISALVRKAKALSDKPISNGKDVFDLYDQNDKIMVQVVTEFYQTLATGIANLIYTFNPSLIVIGGGVSNRGERFIQELNEQLKVICEEAFYKQVTLKLSHYNNDSGLIGALVHFMMRQV